MTAPLREVLVKAPGPAFGRAFDDPAHGFLRPVDLDLARRQHDGLVATPRPPRRPRPRARRRDRRSRPRVRVRPAARRRRRRDPAAPGQAQPGRRAGAARALDAGRAASRRSAASRPRARSRAATRSGCAPTCCASGGRCGRTMPARASWRRSWAATSRVFDVPYWKGPAELVHLLSVISPVADDLAVVFLPLLPAGLHALLAELGVRLVEVPEDEYPRLGCNVLAVRPGVVIVAEGNDGTRRGLEAAGLRGPRDPAGRGRRERVGRRDLPDPADPARLSAAYGATMSISRPRGRRGGWRPGAGPAGRSPGSRSGPRPGCRGPCSRRPPR